MIRRITIMICIAYSANAQAPFLSEVEILGGPSLSNYWGKNKPEDQVMNFTYFYGGGMSHRFENRLGINAKFFYERMGNRMEYTETLYDNNNIPTTYDFVQGYKLDYLTLIVTLRYFIDNNERFYVGLGGFVSHLSKSKSYTEMRSVVDGSTTYFYLNNDTLNDFDFGITPSVGYRIPLRSKLMINIELLGNVGLADIDDSTPEASLKNFSLMLGVGFTYKL